MGTGSFPGVKCGRGVLLTTHPLLVPRSWKSRAISQKRLCRFKWTRPFRRKTKSGFCACAITFQTQSTCCNLVTKTTMETPDISFTNQDQSNP